MMNVWIAKDKDGSINVFLLKPVKNKSWTLNRWLTDDINPVLSNVPQTFLEQYNINPSWDDEEPIEVDLLFNKVEN